MFSFKKVIFIISIISPIFLILSAAISTAAEETQTLTGHIYCVLPTDTGVKLEPGVCPGGEGHGAHILKTPDGKLILLQETLDLEKNLSKLTAEQKKNVTMEGKMVGPTTFNPETIKWPWLQK
jgi:hypothetical protein